MMATVGHFSNTNVLYREIEDLRDLLASIEDNGEMYVGEMAKVAARLAAKEEAAAHDR